MSWNKEVQRRNHQMSRKTNNNYDSPQGEWQTQTEELLVRHTDKQIDELSSTVRELKGVSPNYLLVIILLNLMSIES